MAYKYRFYPDTTQKEMLAKTFGCVRVVYNHLLDWRNKEYTLHGNKINYTKTSNKLTQLKQDENFKWLNEVSSVALQQTLRNQDKAFSNFFNKRARYPNFKRKNNNQSFCLANNGFKFKDGKLYIAKSNTPLNVRWSRKLDGKVGSITISKDCANRYFVSFCTEVEIKQKPAVNKTVGIDLGLTAFAITSDGNKINPLKALIKYQTKLATLQKRLSKKQKKSNNRNKARIKVAKLHNRIKDSRQDFLEPVYNLI